MWPAASRMDMTKIAAAILALSMFATPALADRWHGERAAEVNARRGNQERRINEGVREGTITHREARHLRGEERAIHAQEHRMERRDGGRLTAHDQRVLNREENRVSRQIRSERRY